VRVLATSAAAIAVAAVVLTRLDEPVRTRVGEAGLGHGTFPVVEIAGTFSEGAGFAALSRALTAQGTPVLDFDPDRPGIQPLTYAPASQGEHVPGLAARVVQPAIEAALARRGFDPATQRVDVVAHSLGGLLMRFLIEHPAADVDRFSSSAGWHGDGKPDVEANWGERVDDLVMVGTPNHGSSLGFVELTLGPGHGRWDGVASDLQPGSPFLRRMTPAEPAGEVYTAIGGDPWFLRWLRTGHHGFDAAVPAESPFMAGAANNTFAMTHGRLLSTPSVVSLVVNTVTAGR
jgi:hypothetical protein